MAYTVIMFEFICGVEPRGHIVSINDMLSTHCWASVMEKITYATIDYENGMHIDIQFT